MHHISRNPEPSQQQSGLGERRNFRISVATGCRGGGGIEIYGAPPCPDCSGYVGGKIVAYHHVAPRIGQARALHGVAVEAAVGFVDAYVVAENHEVDAAAESGGGYLAVLHLGESVGQHTYIISLRAKPSEQLGGAG